MAAKKKAQAPKGKAKSKPPAPKRPTSRARDPKVQAPKPAPPPRIVFTDRADAKAKKTERIAQLRAEALASAVAQNSDRPLVPGPESDKDTRIAYCVTLMARLQWLVPSAYETRVALATAWGVTESTVRDYAAEASRRIRANPEDVEAGKMVLARQCEDVRNRARTTFNEQTGMPDFGAELKAIEMTGRYQGFDEEKAKKIELTGKDGGPITTAAPAIMMPQEIEE